MSDKSDMDTIIEAMKKQPGKHYRFVRTSGPDSDINVSRKRLRGYKPVMSSDPEAKGTILEKRVAVDGQIRFGTQTLMSIPKEQYLKYRKEVRERTDSKLAAIRDGYQGSGEDVKRKLGKRHKDFNVFIKEEE